MRPSFFHHLHPPTIPAPQARLRYTLGAGGLAVYLTLVLVVTGILEMFYYSPTASEAAQSIQMITYLAPFGWLLRNLHYWAAQLFVLTMALHLLRVVFTGAYIPPRRFNYLLGLVLLVVGLFLDFTGYVLRWDTGVHWALVTGTNLIRTIPIIGTGLYTWLIGGSQPGSATLLRFYTWHTIGLMLLLALGGGWHLFRVRRDGGIAVPPPAVRLESQRITRFELVRREVLAMIWASVVLLGLSIVLPAPLAPPLQAGSVVSVEARAPWFFLWVQQLLKLGNPFIFGVLVPLGAVVLLALIPYLFPQPAPIELGRWFPRGGRAAQVAAGLLALAILLLTFLALAAGSPALR